MFPLNNISNYFLSPFFNLIFFNILIFLSFTFSLHLSRSKNYYHPSLRNSLLFYKYFIFCLTFRSSYCSFFTVTSVFLPSCLSVSQPVALSSLSHSFLFNLKVTCVSVHIYFLKSHPRLNLTVILTHSVVYSEGENYYKATDCILLLVKKMFMKKNAVRVIFFLIYTFPNSENCGHQNGGVENERLQN